MSHFNSILSSPRLPDQITVEHGPKEFLAHYFLALDLAVRSRGIKLSLRTDPAGLASVREEYPEIELAPVFNYRLGGAKAENMFWMEGKNEEGKTVALQAARCYDFSESNLADELESMRVFYTDPVAQSQGAECFKVSAPSASSITGRVVYSGSTWVRKDFRGRDLASYLPRISRAVALTRWNPAFTVSMVKTELVKKRVAERYGYTNVEELLRWMNSEFADEIRFALVWMPRSECVTDMRSFAQGKLRSELDLPLQGQRDIDVWVQQGRAG